MISCFPKQRNAIVRNVEEVLYSICMSELPDPNMGAIV
jgi:hypothetical protein